MNQPIREYAWGPTLRPDGTTRFRLWAPEQTKVSLRVDGQETRMIAQDEGWFEAVVRAPTGSDYGFVLSNGDFVPDPASRSQLDVLGPSRVVDPDVYEWRNVEWEGRPWEEAVFYEIHVGTFTPEGTFLAAIDKLAYLADLGFTAIEIMPLAHFPGGRGWGYDGVFHYAPFEPYGPSEAFKAFVDAAHGHGLMVFLDVVYNHFGPEGNFLSQYAPSFFCEDNPTPWGPRIAFSNGPVRRFFIENAIYWLTEYHLDGLRFDAIDHIEDESAIHILKELALEAYATVSNRLVHLITENPANGTDLMTETEDGTRLYKADWNDDFHHALHSAVTGENAGYYEPLSTDAWRNTAKALAQGHLKQGKRILGIEPPAPSALPTTCYVHFLQNHDQVGNRATGERLHQSLNPNQHAALVEMLVMSPQIPLFFQGDDHMSLRPFRFFADYQGTLRTDVWKNRETEAVNFGGFPDGVGPEDIPDPSDVATFEGSKLDWNEAELRDRKDWRVFLKRLFQARRDHVVPLLGPLMRGGKALACPEGCVFVDWQAPNGLLKLRANLSIDRVTIKEDPNFEIYPGNRLEGDRWLYGNSVRVFRTIE